MNIVSKAPTADLAMTTLTENVSQTIFVSRILIMLMTFCYQCPILNYFSEKGMGSAEIQYVY